MKPNSLSLALADLDTSESHGCAADFLEQVANGLGRILDIGLLEQDVLLVEGIETAFHDLRNDLLRLALGQGLLGGHATLGLDHIGRNVLAGQPLGAHGGDLQSSFVSHGGAGLVGGDHGDDARRHLGGLLVSVDFDVLAGDLGELADLDATTRYDLHTRLAGMHTHNKVCHGDFRPSNIIIGNDGVNYVIDWAHVTQGNGAADAARTYLLFCLRGDQKLANKYLDLFCKKTDTAKQYVQKWLPIVAASQSVKGNPEERDFLLRWADVVDYE